MSTNVNDERSADSERIGRQVAHAYRAGLADARRQVTEWANEQMQALPDCRTPVAHGKAELLTDLRGFITVRAEQTARADSSTRPAEDHPSVKVCGWCAGVGHTTDEHNAVRPDDHREPLTGPGGGESDG